MAGCLTIRYRFDFEDGTSVDYPLLLDGESLRLISEKPFDPPAWAALEIHQCSCCAFTPGQTTYCPIAINLAQIVERFGDQLSYRQVAVTVTSDERTYSKQTTIQQGLSSLLGLVMVSSGCRAMDQLKPMVRFHLPFASVEETAFRSLTMYLVGCYLRQRRGEPVAWGLAGLEAIYDGVGEVNRAFADRLRSAARKDANVNALVNLHCFAQMVPGSAEELLDQLEIDYAALLAPTGKN